MDRAPSTDRRRVRFGIVLVAVAAATAVLMAQAPAVGGHHDSATEPPAGQVMTPGAERMQMMQSMAAADERLSALLAKMNTATGSQKVDAIAAVVTELAAQRTQMREQMRMQSEMMEQMMSRMSMMHGSGGMTKGMPEPKKDATDADHAAHHPDK